MAGSKEIREMLKATNTSVKALAQMRGISYQTMRNKLYNDSFTYAELIQIADLLGYDVPVIKRGKE